MHYIIQLSYMDTIIHESTSKYDIVREKNTLCNIIYNTVEKPFMSNIKEKNRFENAWNTYTSAWHIFDNVTLYAFADCVYYFIKIFNNCNYKFANNCSRNLCS